MKKFLIQVGVVVSLTGIAVLPVYAEHKDVGFAPEFSRVTVRYYDGYRRSDWRDYRYGRDFRHARRHQRQHGRQHRRDGVRHNSWHWRNDNRWDGYYDDDHADLHHDQRHGHRDSHRRQRRHS